MNFSYGFRMFWTCRNMDMDQGREKLIEISSEMRES